MYHSCCWIKKWKPLSSFFGYRQLRVLDDCCLRWSKGCRSSFIAVHRRWVGYISLTQSFDPLCYIFLSDFVINLYFWSSSEAFDSYLLHTFLLYLNSCIFSCCFTILIISKIFVRTHVYVRKCSIIFINKLKKKGLFLFWNEYEMEVFYDAGTCIYCPSAKRKWFFL